MPFTYEHARPALTTDCVVLAFGAGALRVVLILRDSNPFQGQWALPGGFVEMDETLEEAALRELREETGIDGPCLEQLHAFGAPGRDPRGRTVSIAYLGLVRSADVSVKAADDARDARWFAADALPDLAFDHDDIIETALSRLRSRAVSLEDAFALLPAVFGLDDLRRLNEILLDRTLDAAAFREEMLATGLLDEVAPGMVARRP